MSAPVPPQANGAGGVPRPTLTVFDAVAMIVGIVIGVGIFKAPSIVAGNVSGETAFIALWVAGGLISLIGALCYAELASSVPVSGSAYTYGYATLGELVAWIIGWDLVLEYALGAATVAVGWSAYVVSLLHDMGIGLPARFVAAPGTVVTLADGSTVTAIVNLPAILVSLAATTLLVIGIRESSRVNNVIVAVKVGVVLAIILIGSFFVVPSLWQPFIPPSEGTFGVYGWSGVLRGAGVIFFAYIGFDAVSTAAQEARRPQRDMPVGIIGSLLVCTVLYVLVSAVMVGLVSFRELGVAAPMATAVDAARMAAHQHDAQLSVRHPPVQARRGVQAPQARAPARGRPEGRGVGRPRHLAAEAAARPNPRDGSLERRGADRAREVAARPRPGAGARTPPTEDRAADRGAERDRRRRRAAH